VTEESGISGQDGTYLAKLLLQNGCEVCGTSRDAQISSFRNLDRLGIRKDVRLASVALKDHRAFLRGVGSDRSYRVLPSRMPVRSFVRQFLL